MVDKELVVEVAEPWDFANSEGGIDLVAKIASVDRDGRVLYAEASEEIHLPRSKVRGRRIRVEPRYVGHRLSAIAAGRKVVVDIGIVEDGNSDAKAKLGLSGLAFLKGCENGSIVS